LKSLFLGDSTGKRGKREIERRPGKKEFINYVTILTPCELFEKGGSLV
jgi:hypothetical protein